jgi:hypothetical protein
VRWRYRSLLHHWKVNAVYFQHTITMGMKVALQENLLNTRVFSTLRLTAQRYGRSGRFDKLLIVLDSTVNLGLGFRLPVFLNGVSSSTRGGVCSRRDC